MGKFIIKDGVRVEGLLGGSGTGTAITYNTASGEFSYTSSAALGGGGADGNGIYDGSGTVPTGTVSTLAGTLRFDNTTGQAIIFQPTNTIVNPNQVDLDFIIRGVADANLLYADASVDRIGVGTSTPSYKLDTVGDINASGGYRVAGTPGLTGNYTFGGGGSGDITSMKFSGGILTAVTTVP